MLTARSILSLRATSTATQCSAALPTIATTIAPMKNSLSPADLGAPRRSSRRGSRDITPTATPAIASATTERRTLHGAPCSCSSSPAGLKRSRCVRSEKSSPADVGEDQDDRDDRARAARRSSRSRRARRRAAAGPCPRPARRSPASPARRPRAAASRTARRRRVRLKRWRLAAEAADEHRGAHHEQDVADDRADDRGLRRPRAGPCVEREQGDDQLRARCRT